MALRCSERLENTITSSKLNNDNQGFSLVEVLIAVFVLAIVFTPVMKSFMTAAITNSKAQMTQDATSLAETIMEEVKGTSIKTLCESVTDDNKKPEFARGTTVKFEASENNNYDTENPSAVNVEGASKTVTAPYRITYNNVTATQGRTYDAVVEITRSEYAKTSSTGGDISDINEWSAPDLSKVNDKDNAVISWEINKYDRGAVDQLVYKITSDKDASAERSNIISAIKSSGKKTINIKIDKVGAVDNTAIQVACEVTYSASYDSQNYSLDYPVYTGFLKKSDTKPLGSIGSVYIFYNTYKEEIAKAIKEEVKSKSLSSDSAAVAYEFKDCFQTESIIINENSNAKDTVDGIAYEHDIYFIRQKVLEYDSSGNGSLKAGSGVSSSSDYIPGIIIQLDGANESELNTGNYPRQKISGGKVIRTFYSNVPNAGVGVNDLYGKEKAKNRIYKVKVTLKKHGTSNFAAELVSTMQAGNEAD